MLHFVRRGTMRLSRVHPDSSDAEQCNERGGGMRAADENAPQARPQQKPSADGTVESVGGAVV